MPKKTFVERTNHISSPYVFETRLRDAVKIVCKEYIKKCRGRWFQMGHNDAEGKIDVANDLLLSARRDNFQHFKDQILSSLQWLDENNHDSTELREPFEQYEQAMSNRDITAYGMNSSTMFRSSSNNHMARDNNDTYRSSNGSNTTHDNSDSNRSPNNNDMTPDNNDNYRSSNSSDTAHDNSDSNSNDGDQNNSNSNSNSNNNIDSRDRVRFTSRFTRGSLR